MQESGKKKWIVCVVVTLVALVLVGAAFVFFQRFFAVENQFPMWKEVTEIKENELVKLTLLEVSIPLDPNDEHGQGVAVVMENVSGRDTGYGKDYAVEFFYKDNWYMVYEPPGYPFMDIPLEAGKKDSVGYWVPKETFAEEGLYRIRVSNLGYCSFHVAFDESEAASWEAA